MTPSLILLFFLKKSPKQGTGTAPLYLRVTLGKSRIEISCRHSLALNRWNAANQKCIGTNEESKQLNSFLKEMERNVYDAYQQMLEQKLPPTAVNLKKVLRNEGQFDKKKMLIPIFKEHNEQVKVLVGKEYARGTYVRYETSLRHTINFIKWKYKTEDIEIDAVTYQFITSYDFYLRSVRKCNNNTTVKYIKNFKKIILHCVDNGWLEKNPFLKYKAKTKEVVREFLTMEDIERMREKHFASERLSQVRDIFLFSCFTGLAYIDVKKLKRQEVVIGLDGLEWIFTARQKTDSPSRIPILPPVRELIKKYEDHPECSDKVLPVLSNQKMNSYLKEIADVCGIHKSLTFHIARHTFATTVTMANGVSIESVSKMLGHKNIRTTQHYAKILDARVSEDMIMLSKKFEKM